MLLRPHLSPPSRPASRIAIVKDQMGMQEQWVTQTGSEKEGHDWLPERKDSDIVWSMFVALRSLADERKSRIGRPHSQLGTLRVPDMNRHSPATTA